MIQKKTNKRLNDLEKKLIELKKYHNHEDDEYRGIKDIKDLFKLSIDEGYYKPVLSKSGYNENYLQYESKGDRILAIHEYLALIEKYLRELINHYKNKGKWKSSKLTAAINFVSLKPGSDEICVMYTRSFNEEIMEGSDTDEVIKSLFESFLKIYDLNLQEKMKGSDFAFDGVNSLYYDFNKMSINRGGSYIDSPQWLKNKSSTNPKNSDDKCFQYAVTLALNVNRIDNHPERISKIKPFIDQYNWKDIDFPAMSKDWKKFELNNEIALNILYVPHNTKKVNIAYKSKHSLTREKQFY